MRLQEMGVKGAYLVKRCCESLYNLVRELNEIVTPKTS